ncbi:MAG TPA: TolC family protein [Candidatus Eisenbacteria bacterium]|nr:TolC family protein [Candidatus Eisenbacteria bacterium]
MLPAVMLAATVAAADSGSRPVTLSQAVSMAQRLAPQAIQAQGAVRSANATALSTYGAFLPSFSLSAGATRQVPSGAGRTRVENGQVVILPAEPWSFSGGFGTNLQIFSGGQRWFDVQQARQEVVAARANQVTQRFSVTLAVKQQFFNVLAARESEEAARAQLQQAEQQHRAAVLRVRAKTATRSDSLRSDIQVRTAHLAVLSARRDLTVANAGLTRAVGSEAPVTAATEELPPPGLRVPESELRALAANSPEVQEARANLSAASASRRGSWATYLPTLGASYSRSANGTNEDFGWMGPDYGYSGSFRLSASIPVFDGFQRQAQIARSQVAEENARANVRDAQLAVHQTLAQALGAFHVAEQQVEAQIATVAASEEDLRVQEQRYAVGGSTILDVLASQSQLTQARQALIRARYDQRVAKAQLEALVGRDL